MVVLLSRPQERGKELPYIGYGKVAASALLLDQAKVSLISCVRDIKRKEGGQSSSILTLLILL